MLVVETTILYYFLFQQMNTNYKLWKERKNRSNAAALLTIYRLPDAFFFLNNK